MIAVIGAIRDDDVIKEMNTHQAAGFLDREGQVVIHIAGPQTPRGVVVANG